jgi:hypothetical protein
MKTPAALAAFVLLALAAAATAGAGQNQATTTLDPQHPSAGQTLLVTFDVTGSTPVVPYEYALQNVCAYPKAHFTLGQTDPIVYWTATGPNGAAEVTMPVYLQSVPAGSSCKVSLVRNNTAVKGSTASYTAQ